jgi:hypothetical protein
MTRRFGMILGRADVNDVIETLHAKYVNLVAVVEDQGLNQGVFDASISVAVRLERSVDEDEQVRQLLAQKGAFSERLRCGMFAAQGLEMLALHFEPNGNRSQLMQQKLHCKHKADSSNMRSV